MYAPNTSEYWGGIRSLYDGCMNEIMAAPANKWGVDPYAWESVGVVMSPIERIFWCEARGYGVVLYPQLPVLGFFADFANPVAKVVIECDGKEFHQDSAKDGKRDDAMRADGWRVYRITGSMCNDAKPLVCGGVTWIERMLMVVCRENQSMLTHPVRRLMQEAAPGMLP